MLDDTSNAWIAAITRGDTPEADRLGRVLDTADQLDHARTTRTDLGAAALAYAARGIAVFPIRPEGKQPLTAHGFKDATTDTATIRGWWRTTPDANIGLPTGHTFDVVDIDGHDGIITMYNGHRPLIDTLTVLGVARTSRDAGRHIYVPTSGLGNKTNVYPGVDYRGIGGYVVAAPSVGANGRRYEWATPLTTATQVAA